MLGVLTPETNTICRLFGMFKTPVKSFVPIKFLWPKIYQYNLHANRICWMVFFRIIQPWIGCHGGGGGEKNISLPKPTKPQESWLTSMFLAPRGSKCTYILVLFCLIYRSRPTWHSGYHLFVRAVEIQFVHVVDFHPIWKYICFLTGNMR